MRVSVPQPYVYIVILWLDFLTETDKEPLWKEIENTRKIIESNRKLRREKEN